MLYVALFGIFQGEDDEDAAEQVSEFHFCSIHAYFVTRNLIFKYDISLNVIHDILEDYITIRLYRCICIKQKGKLCAYIIYLVMHIAYMAHRKLMYAAILNEKIFNHDSYDVTSLSM